MSWAAVETVIEGAGLHKHFGGVAALDDFAIDVHGGEIRCIVGRNEAGKSTLFKAVAARGYVMEGGPWCERVRSTKSPRTRPSAVTWPSRTRRGRSARGEAS